VPPLEARVTDLTGTLSPDERRALEEKLARFEARKGAQVAVLVVPSTAPEPTESYAIRVVDDWKLGRAGSDDGALLLVAKDDRRVRIEVGRGLEGALTDLLAKRILDETIAPRLRAGDFAGGIDAGVDRILAVIEGEPLPPPAPRQRPPGDGAADGSPLFLMGFPLASVVLRAALGLAGPFLVAAVAAGAAWLVTGQLALAVALGTFTLLFGLVAGGGRRWSNRRRGRFGGAGWGGGGWGGGGGGGGGFSGGGGGFGGGGASGSW
jgi:uncharacterized protein